MIAEGVLMYGESERRVMSSMQSKTRLNRILWLRLEIDAKKRR